MCICVYLILTGTKKKKQRKNLDRFRVEFILLDRVARETSMKRLLSEGLKEVRGSKSSSCLGEEHSKQRIINTQLLWECA